MIGTGDVKLTEVNADLDVSGKGLSSPEVRGRVCKPYGNISLTELRNSVTGMPHQAQDYGLNPTLRDRWCPDANVGSRQYSVSAPTGNLSSQVQVNVQRWSQADAASEVRTLGRIGSSGTYRLSGSFRGAGSGGYCERGYGPAAIAVASADAGYLNGSVNLNMYEEFYGGTGTNVPFSYNVNLDTSRSYIAVIVYQYVYGPLHQPPPDMPEVNLNLPYSSVWESIKLRKI